MYLTYILIYLGSATNSTLYETFGKFFRGKWFEYCFFFFNFGFIFDLFYFLERQRTVQIDKEAAGRFIRANISGILFFIHFFQEFILILFS